MVTGSTINKNNSNDSNDNNNKISEEDEEEEMKYDPPGSHLMSNGNVNQLEKNVTRSSSSGYSMMNNLSSSVNIDIMDEELD
jgi:hypothetical protein